jgi:hypothetical protein
MRTWWRTAVKAMGVACLVYVAGVLAQTLHSDGCPVSDPTCSSDSPTEGHLLLATGVAFLVAYGVLLLRAIRRKRLWRP